MGLEVNQGTAHPGNSDTRSALITPAGVILTEEDQVTILCALETHSGSTGGVGPCPQWL